MGAGRAAGDGRVLFSAPREALGWPLFLSEDLTFSLLFPVLLILSVVCVSLFLRAREEEEEEEEEERA